MRPADASAFWQTRPEGPTLGVGMQDTIARIRKFRDDRDWQQFHDPKNLAVSISIEAAELLELLGLAGIQRQAAGNLPLGTQKRVELARALALEPTLLLLDEPASGLNTAEMEAFAEVLLQVRDRFELTILLVEHDMGLVMTISDTITVLNFGRKIAEGTPRDVQSNPDVIKAYLGESAGVDAR